MAFFFLFIFHLIPVQQLDVALTPLKTKMLFPFLDNLYRQLTSGGAPSAGEVQSSRAAAGGGQAAERSGQAAGGGLSSKTTGK